MKDPDPQQVEMTTVKVRYVCRLLRTFGILPSSVATTALEIGNPGDAVLGAQNSLPVSAPLTPDGAMSVAVAGLQSRVSRAARGGLITSE
jgi:hypothetical protein